MKRIQTDGYSVYNYRHLNRAIENIHARSPRVARNITSHHIASNHIIESDATDSIRSLLY